MSSDSGAVEGAFGQPKLTNLPTDAPLKLMGMHVIGGMAGSAKHYDHHYTPLDLRHERMGHISKESLLKHHDIYFPDESRCYTTHACIGCALAKRAATPRKFLSHRKKDTLGFFSVDVMVLESTPSAQGTIYVYTAVDNATRMVFGFAAENKDANATIEVLHSLKLEASKFGFEVDHLKSDRGELIADQVQSYVADQGWSMEFTPSCSSYANSVVENKHYRIRLMAATVLAAAHLRQKFHQYAVTQSCVIQNHLVSTFLENKKKTNAEVRLTPILELCRLVELSGGKVWAYVPIYPRLRVFGCVAYSYITRKSQRKGKLCKVSHMGLHFGNADMGRSPDGYVIVDMHTGQESISRNVLFDEHNLTLRLHPKDKAELEKLFCPPIPVSSIHPDDLETPGQLEYRVKNKSGKYIKRKLTVLHALQTHIAIAARLGDTDIKQTDMVIDATNPYEDGYGNQDLADMVNPAPSAKKSFANAHNKVFFTNESVLVKNNARVKQIKADHIRNRVRRAHNKTVSEILQLTVKNSKGEKCKYRRGDISYDLERTFLQVKSDDHTDTIAKAVHLFDPVWPLHSQVDAIAEELQAQPNADDAVSAACIQLSMVNATMEKIKPVHKHQATKRKRGARPSCRGIKPLGRVPKNIRHIDTFPEPWRSCWDYAVVEEQLAQVETKAFDYLPITHCRNAMHSKPQRMVAVRTEKQLPNDEKGQQVLERAKWRDCLNGKPLQPLLDFSEIESPTMSGFTHKLLHALARVHGFASQQFDLPHCFLQTPQTDPLLAWPSDEKWKYRDPNGVPYILSFHRATYGSKTASALWWREFRIFVTNELGFIACKNLPSVFVKQIQDHVLWVGLYVDDGLVFYNNLRLLKWFEERVTKRFKAKWFGRPWSFLGQVAEFDEKNDRTKLSLQSYLEQVMPPHGIDQIVPPRLPVEVNIRPEQRPQSDAIKQQMKNKPYAEILGIIGWFRNNVGAQYAYAFNRLASVTSNPSPMHFKQLQKCAAHVYKHRKLGWTCHGMNSNYSPGIPELEDLKPNDLYILFDANFGTEDTSCPQVCAQAYYGHACVLDISIQAKLTAMATAEAEVIASCEAVKLAVFVRKCLAELRFPVTGPVPCFGDNASQIALSKKSHPSRKCRWWRTRVDWTQSLQDLGIVSFHKIAGVNNASDCGTKIQAVCHWEGLSRPIVGAPPMFIPGTQINVRLAQQVAKEERELRATSATSPTSKSPSVKSSRPEQLQDKDSVATKGSEVTSRELR